MEKPSNIFFSKPDASSIPLKKVSLNKVNSNTPFLISPSVAEKTYSFGEKVMADPSIAPKETYDNHWEDQYEDSSIFFIPENRWTHECTRTPEHIEKSKYKIYSDADIKVQPSRIGLELVTRTLLPYIEVNENPSDHLLSFYELNKDKYVPFFYNWIVRWTPRNNCKLLFYSDQEIEDTFLIKVPEFVVDYETDMPNIKVPFFISSQFFPKKTVIRHDSAIMYIEVISEGQ